MTLELFVGLPANSLLLLHIVTLSEPLIMNVKGQNINILPLIKGQTKKSLSNKLSNKTDDPFLIDRYEKFFSIDKYMYFQENIKIITENS